MQPGDALISRLADVWSADSQHFDGPQLRLHIVLRGWTIATFSKDADLSESTVRSAVAGHRMSDRTALRILTALNTREAMDLDWLPMIEE